MRRRQTQPVRHDEMSQSGERESERWSRRSGVKSVCCLLFASFSNKDAQSVYQTALMKGLLDALAAADPLDPEPVCVCVCVYHQSASVSTVS